MFSLFTLRSALQHRQWNTPSLRILYSKIRTLHDGSSKITCDRHLMTLCKAGRLDDALAFVQQMVSRKVPLSHYTLTALLNGCCRGHQHHRYRHIWSWLTVDHNVEPNVASYLMAATTASHCGDTKAVYQWIAASKQKSSDKLDSKSRQSTFYWNQILDALRRIGDVDAVMAEYEAMTAAPDQYTISIVLNAVIQSERFDVFESMLTEITNSQRLRHCINHKVMAVILDGLMRSERVHLLSSLWSTLYAMVNEMDCNCFGVALMAAQRIPNEMLMDEIVTAVKRQCAEELGKEDLCWHRILSAYGRMQRFDKMWSEFECMKWFKGNGRLDVVTFHILLRFDDRIESQQRALNEMKSSLCHWNWRELTLSHFAEIKAIHRVAAKVNDEMIKKTLSPFLRSDGDHKLKEMPPVRASFQWKGQMFSFNNFYDEQQHHDVDQLVHELMDRSGHRLETRNYTEISPEFARKLLSNHAEKKALAFVLLNEEKECNIHSEEQRECSVISINVNHPMCSDCHRFYAAVSLLFPSRVIVCNDPHSQHRFKRGACCCCQK